ncbi:MAG: alpha/beta fold hydrolase, partial [Actinomycetes bacterium]
MSVKTYSKVFSELPWMPDSRIVAVPQRGEFFVRYSKHENANAPVVALLHGWTGNADINFFPVYADLAQHYSVLAVDHRGHGRGLRTNDRFALEDCADDVVAIMDQLGIPSVTAVGYSMGGPIAMLVCKRHATRVHSLVLCATALEWSATRGERTRWKIGRVVSPVFRLLTTPRLVNRYIKRKIPRTSSAATLRPWLVAEIRRNDSWAMNQAGRALSKHDARPWAATLGVPTVSIVTARDSLVAPNKQQALAQATNATVIEIDGDHLVNWQKPELFTAA